MRESPRDCARQPGSPAWYRENSGWSASTSSRSVRNATLCAVLRHRQLLVAPFAFQEHASRHVVERTPRRRRPGSVPRGGGEGQNGGLVGEVVVGDPLVAGLAARGQVQQDQRGTVLLPVVGVVFLAGTPFACFACGRRFRGDGFRLRLLGAVRVVLVLDRYVRDPASLARDLVALDGAKVADLGRPRLISHEDRRDVRDL